MSIIASFALFGYPFLVVLFFSFMRPRDAVIWSYLIGWLYLPLLSLDIPGLPNYGKFTASNVAVLPCILIFDYVSLRRLRFAWTDVAMGAWIIAPFAASMTNGLGVYDALAGATAQVLAYGIPYLVGRLYLINSEGVLYFRYLLFLAAASYVPLILFESRMSPLLHQWIYGV